ncbi:hypothetical protein [Paenibacillus sp. MBLB4367]|uniref:hypothetical protein n=1 Tax=Paenibacillus sp. MBLB4367 TaxID=3384767 RepID=UPI0039080A8D
MTAEALIRSGMAWSPITVLQQASDAGSFLLPAGWLRIAVVAGGCGAYVLGGYALLKGIIRLHERHGVCSINYRGDRIATGLGIFLWSMLAIGTFLYAAGEQINALWFGASGFRYAPDFRYALRYLYVLCLSGVFVVGWVDDRFGDMKVKGLSGHARRLLQGGWTTGLSKAAIGVMLAAVFAFAADRTWGERLLHILLISLAMNAVNLLDLRPGRALKLYLIGAGLLLVCAMGRHMTGQWLALFYPLSMAVLLLLPSDLRGNAMLGDCGSNMLGFALGCGLVVFTDSGVQISVVVLLILMHLAAERVSLTAVIERHTWLNWLDRFGRTEK